MPERIERSFRRLAPAVEDWTLRVVEAHHEQIAVRRDVLQPVLEGRDAGAMITVTDGGGTGYAATADLAPAGLARAAATAREWARRSAALGGTLPGAAPRSSARGRYASPLARPWEETPLAEKIALLREACARLRIDPRIVDRQAVLRARRSEVLFASAAGARIEQRFDIVEPALVAVANEGARTQRRSHGLVDGARQGGMEALEAADLPGQAGRVAAEALELLDAPPCPGGEMDVLLLPGQMILQIHESIGHPLELDRILGDERNYAGRSFVTPEMFGRYRYGSELLNVTFDPGRPGQLASYAWDDEGTPAERHHLIRDGVLLRPLGGAGSQARAGLDGVACSRASGWNRPPVDRMANVNLEPGDADLDALIASVERGVLMDTNRSWSIDDSRNKFQFGCEYGRLIEDGRLGRVVRDPAYRGVSATFWRSLAAVGGPRTLRVLGVTSCGKGEPNQLIHAGHAAPACVFRGVTVLGGR